MWTNCPPAPSARTKNEWDLLLEACRSADAGEAQFRLSVLSPPRWTIFSGHPARVRGADGTTYELGPDFPAVLHELIRAHLDTCLDWHKAPPLYALSFRPGKRHPRFDPAPTTAPEPGQGPGRLVLPGSHQVLRSFLNALPPEDSPLAPGGDGDASGPAGP